MNPDYATLAEAARDARDEEWSAQDDADWAEPHEDDCDCRRCRRSLARREADRGWW